MTVDQASRPGPVAAARELWSYRSLVLNLANRQLKSQYKQSLLGNLWSLLNPALTLGVYSLVFGVFLDFGRSVPVGGNGELKSFPMYLFCALIMWSLFNRAALGAMGQFSSTGALLRKVYFPPSAPIVAHGLAQIRQSVLEGAVAMVVMALLGNAAWTFVLWPLLIPPMLVFSLGIALVLSLANAYFKDTSYITQIGSQLLFYCTPIIYSIERVGDTEVFGIKATTLLSLNPLTQFVGASRDLLYLHQIPSGLRIAAILGVSVVSLLVGWLVFVRGSENVGEVV